MWVTWISGVCDVSVSFRSSGRPSIVMPPVEATAWRQGRAGSAATATMGPSRSSSSGRLFQPCAPGRTMSSASPPPATTSPPAPLTSRTGCVAATASDHVSAA